MTPLATVATGLSAAQRELADAMVDISQAAYFATWMAGLEYALWTARIEGPRRYGIVDLDAAQIERLATLSRACGGWIVWTEGRGETFVPIDAWRRQYASAPEPER